ncbi:MAG: hypothetical protein FWC11_05360 [Firmicutes bacterium]|nr:hypothetical protein [Bacillota bacterium]
MKKLLTIILIIVSLVMFTACFDGIFGHSLNVSAGGGNHHATCRVYGCEDCAFNMKGQQRPSNNPTCRVYNCIDCKFNTHHNGSNNIFTRNTQRNTRNCLLGQGIMCLVYNCPTCTPPQNNGYQKITCLVYNCPTC